MRRTPLGKREGDHLKPLVVYYSRTGSNRTLAERLAKTVGAECYEIVDRKNRKGLLGFIRSASDAFRRKLTRIELGVDPAGYDPIIIGAPVWAGRMTPAVRTFLTNQTLSGKRLYFFSVSATGTPGTVFEEMKRLAAGAVLRGCLAVRQKDLATGTRDQDIQSFVQAIRGG